MSHTYKPNLYQTTTNTVEHTISTLAYMDNTSWIAPNKNNMEIILGITDSFNELNNIKVNKDKSELLMHQPKVPYQQALMLNFGNETVNIKPARRTESI